MNVDILGTDYQIIEKTDDPYFDRVDAYCDQTTKEIVINADFAKGAEIHNVEWYRKKILRHEILHAFLYESGLDEQSVFDNEHHEQMVEWTAMQFPKILKIFEEVGAL